MLPDKMFNKDDFPAPLGPRIDKISPFFISISIFSRILILLYRREIFSD